MNERAISIVALVFSIVATSVSAWQAVENYKQNRILTRPALSLRTSVGNNIEQQGLFMKNRGFGPAVIKDFDVFYRGKEYDSFAHVVQYIYDTRSDPSFAASTGLDSKDIEKIWDNAQHASWNMGDEIGANEDVPLFVVEQDVFPRQMPAVQFFRNDLGLEIRYCSIRDSDCDWECLNRNCSEQS